MLLRLRPGTAIFEESAGQRRGAQAASQRLAFSGRPDGGENGATQYGRTMANGFPQGDTVSGTQSQSGTG